MIINKYIQNESIYYKNKLKKATATKMSYSCSQSYTPFTRWQHVCCVLLWLMITGHIFCVTIMNIVCLIYDVIICTFEFIFQVESSICINSTVWVTKFQVDNSSRTGNNSTFIHSTTWVAKCGVRTASTTSATSRTVRFFRLSYGIWPG